MTQEERETIRKHIAIWRETARELERMKAQELRSLTETQAAEYFASLDTDIEAWRTPDRRDGAGLVEQQRWFLKAHEARSGS